MRKTFFCFFLVQLCCEIFSDASSNFALQAAHFSCDQTWFGYYIPFSTLSTFLCGCWSTITLTKSIFCFIYLCLIHLLSPGFLLEANFCASSSHHHHHLIHLVIALGFKSGHKTSLHSVHLRWFRSNTCPRFQITVSQIWNEQVIRILNLLTSFVE